MKGEAAEINDFFPEVHLLGHCRTCFELSLMWSAFWIYILANYGMFCKGADSFAHSAGCSIFTYQEIFFICNLAISAFQDLNSSFKKRSRYSNFFGGKRNEGF